MVLVLASLVVMRLPFLLFMMSMLLLLLYLSLLFIDIT